VAEKISGVNSVLEALYGRRKIHKIYLQDNRNDAKINEIAAVAAKKGVYCQKTDKKAMDAMSRHGHQGVIAEVDNFPYVTVKEILAKADKNNQKPFVVLLDGIEDPQNLGAIIRVAECTGVHGIILPKHHASEVNETVVKASAGAVEHMLLAQVTNLVQCIKELKQAGLWVVGADMLGGEVYFKQTIPTPVALVIGGENRGIRRLVKENCDLLVQIPMAGSVGSLNAAMAAGLIMYEVVRQSQN